MGEWWRDAVVYQLYPRSFADSDGDGVGDLRGVIERLDHLAWLGIDTLWLNPTFPSPNADWGYDVADYRGVHPELGTMDDLDELIAGARERDIRVLLDLVPNHTSIEHPWFEEARASKDAPRRDWYVWADPAPDGGPPNNWVSNFMGPAWTLDETTGQYYLHNFLPEQPDLDWWNEDVRAEFDDILRFWFDRGVAGFRIDVCHMVIKDAELRDNPPAGDDDSLYDRLRGQRQVYNADRPEVHDVFRRWREVAEEPDPTRLLLGEVYLLEIERLARYYGERDDELQLAFNIPFLHLPFEPGPMREAVSATQEVFPLHAWPCWTGSNHDTPGRMASRWGANEPGRIRMALMMLLTLRGTPVLYYGDEIGLPNVEVERERLQDPVGIHFYPYAGRDGGRTPMQWSAEAGAGFTEPGVEPWLPFGDLSVNVADQRDDPASTLHFCRDLIALRRELDALREATYVALDTPEPVWTWRRDEVTVALNFSDEPAVVDGVEGTIRLCTDRERDGETVEGALELGPWQGTVVA